MKKIIFSLLTFSITVLSFAQNFTSGGINYSVTSPTTAQVVDNNSFVGVATIPVNVVYNSTSYLVTSINFNAFKTCTGLTSITIPNSVTNIGDSAFKQCTGLLSVTIPNSVTSIRMSAFASCSGLTSINIPDSVSILESGVFSFCTSLTSVVLPNSITMLNAVLFQGCTSLSSVTIPNTITSIGFYTFADCTGLTSVTIPNSVTSFGSNAFGGCTNLTSVIIDKAIPIIINANLFQNVPYATATLYVPASSIAAYEAAPVWTNFNTIASITLANNNFEKNNKINVYPNPATNILNISLEENTTIDRLTITDISGKKILEQVGNATIVNIESLAKGMYVLEVFANGNKMVNKFIKN